jgi:hypothetical protein
VPGSLPGYGKWVHVMTDCIDIPAHDALNFKVGDPVRLNFPFRPWYVRVWRWLTRANRRNRPCGTFVVTAVDDRAGRIVLDDDSSCRGRRYSDGSYWRYEI